MLGDIEDVVHDILRILKHIGVDPLKDIFVARTAFRRRKGYLIGAVDVAGADLLPSRQTSGDAEPLAQSLKIHVIPLLLHVFLLQYLTV